MGKLYTIRTHFGPAPDVFWNSPTNRAVDQVVGLTRKLADLGTFWDTFGLVPEQSRASPPESVSGLPAVGQVTGLIIFKRGLTH